MKGLPLIASTVKELKQYRDEMTDELQAILQWWKQHAKDDIHGGYFGAVNNDNVPDIRAPKGLVLHSRILWTFSSAALLPGYEAWSTEADAAYAYLVHTFGDKEYGGMYWSVHPDGAVADGKKQVYGQAFAMYGLVAYYQLTGRQSALDWAITLFFLLEKYSHDHKYGGYTEAFAQDWSSLADLRLSEKELNVSKTMNTHLHVIEAYASLYQVWKDPLLAERIEELLEVFYSHIIDKQKMQQRLFFLNDWQPQASVISFGHDVEAAWLLQECAAALGKKEWLSLYQQYAVSMATAVLPALDSDGSLWYEYDPQANHWIKEKHWWPQAEAMVGFFNAWQLSGDEQFLKHSMRAWDFCRTFLKDKKAGEWYWGIAENGRPMADEVKAGFWKCPYHNGRACLELIRRIETL